MPLFKQKFNMSCLMSKVIAVIDLGSNSFHMTIMKLDDKGKKTTLLRKKQQVQLRAGVDATQHLTKEAMQTALNCLDDFAIELKKHRVDQAKIIGTFTLRLIKDNQKFTHEAQQILGFPVQILSGEEEARFIYQGALLANKSHTKKKNLVVDIGGGSTELILGQGQNIISLCSLPMGCVSFQQQFFADGILSRQNFMSGIAMAKNIIQPYLPSFIQNTWQNCYGSSGTIHTVGTILQHLGWPARIIDQAGLELIQAKLMEMGQVNKIEFEGMREDRKGILPGGLVILMAIFELLKIKKLSVSTSGVREAAIHMLVQEVMQ
jgi:exopolyphosphatase/guanosine-5'-triphosphate,3'-diphosphate pyrophosphatase